MMTASACSTGTVNPVVAESSVSHVRRRTTYRVKISNSKELEALSTAAKYGLTSWVGGQKVRIVGVAEKEFRSQVSTSESLSSSTDENVNGSLKASFPLCQAPCQYTPVTNGIYSTASGGSGCSTSSVAVMSDTESCSSSISSDAGDSKPEHFVMSTAFQSCRTSKCQSLLLSSHYQPYGSSKATADTGMASVHCSSGSLKSLVKSRSYRESVGHSSLIQGLPHGIYYLGTVAFSSQNITANHSNTGLPCQSVTDAAVISALKRITKHMNTPNGDHLRAPTIRCIQNKHIRICNQPLNQSLAVSDRYLKRPYTEDDNADVVSPKRMASSITSSFDCVEVNSCSNATNSGTNRQPLTSNMLNHVPARLGNYDKKTGCNDCSINDTVKNCQHTVEVNNNCSSQQRLLSSLLPKLRLPSGSSMLLFYSLGFTITVVKTIVFVSILFSLQTKFIGQT